MVPPSTTLDILCKTNKTERWEEGSLPGDLTYPKLGVGEAGARPERQPGSAGPPGSVVRLVGQGVLGP